MNSKYSLDIAACLFAILLTGGLTASWLSRGRKARAEDASTHLARFVIWIAVTAGAMGLLASMTLRWTYLREELDVEGTIALLAFVTGVPVALAGSTYAILLAYRSIQVAESQQALESRLVQQQVIDNAHSRVGQVSLGLLRLASEIDSLNVASSQVHRDALLGLSDLVMAPSRNTEHYAAVTARLNEAMLRYRSAVGSVVSAVSDISQNPLSLGIMDSQLAARSYSGAAVIAASTSVEVYGGEGTAYFDYAIHSEESQTLKLLTSLQALHSQAGKLKVNDLMYMALRSSLDSSLERLRRGERIPLPDPSSDPDVLFSDFVNAPTRRLQPQAELQNPLRMLLDLYVCYTDQDLRVLSVAEVLIADLILSIPSKDRFVAYFKNADDTGLQSLAGPMARADLFAEIAGGLPYPQGSPVSPVIQRWANGIEEASRIKNLTGLVEHDTEYVQTSVAAALAANENPVPVWGRTLRTYVLGYWLEIEVLKLKLESIDAAAEFVSATQALALADGYVDMKRIDWLLMAARLCDGEGKNWLEKALDAARTLARDGEINQFVSEFIEAEISTGYPGRRAEFPHDTRLWSSKKISMIEAWLEGQAWSVAPMIVSIPGGELELKPEDFAARDGFLPALLISLGEDAGVKFKLRRRASTSGLTVDRFSVVDMPTLASALDSFLQRHWDETRGRYILDGSALLSPTRNS